MYDQEKTSIFVANIPFDVLESDLQETLKMAGPFVKMDLKMDPERKQHKGYGFCQYKDADIAASALKNLNRLNINGR